MMNELMLIVFGLAVIRALVPLAKDDYSGGQLFVAVTMCWAYYHLLFNCITITIN